MANVVGKPALTTETFRKIEARLRNLTPPIELRSHLLDTLTDEKAPATAQARKEQERSLVAMPHTLGGVEFVVKDRGALLRALRSAYSGSYKTLAESSKKAIDWDFNWALSASMSKTDGLGFREPWRYYLNERAAWQEAEAELFAAPRLDSGFAQYFGAANTVNLTALHVSVAFAEEVEDKKKVKDLKAKDTWCNIHIDENGVTMWDPLNPGKVTITPIVVNHTFNELFFKTDLANFLHLPGWFVERVNLHVLSPEMGFERIGVSVDVLKGDTYKLTVSASCGLMSCKDVEFSRMLKLDASAFKSINPTVSFTKSFELGGGS